MYRLLLTLACLLAALGAQAQTVLFHTGDSTGFPYRIPAIATARGGQVVALTDRRPCGGDIGFGRVDILGRTSDDNGASWSAPFEVLVGTGSGPDTGFGDACLVADRERRELLLVCASGDVPYWKSTPAHPLRIVATRAGWDRKAGRWVWEQPADLTELFYQDLFGGNIGGLFMGSGRICQSRQIKKGRYYRLYAALCTHRGNFVVYSDDFGRTWDVLGSATQSCAPKGDEPKCEELPDGSVLLSSRKQGGRYFNIFRYTDTDAARGVWGAAVDSKTAPGGIRNEGGACNGEILILPVRDAAGSRTWLALQSIPAGPARSHVTLYWKELAGRADYLTPLAFASDWEGSYEVTDKGSGYSTMTLQADGRIGFFYEEEPGAYQMVYRALDLADVTGGRFRTE